MLNSALRRLLRKEQQNSLLFKRLTSETRRSFVSVTSDTLADAVQGVRQHKPLVQCITNYVSMDIMANTLCASDMSPAMVHGGRSGESEEFAKIAQAVNINLGTLDDDWAEGAKAAVGVCNSLHTPFVIDPVGVGFLSYRTTVLKDIITTGKPTVLRGNPSECVTIARFFPELDDIPATISEKDTNMAAKGVDSAHGSDAVNKELIDALARQMGGVVCMTGAYDYCSDGNGARFLVKHPVPELQDVIATGCALGSVIAGFCAVEKMHAKEPNFVRAAVHGCGYFTLAAQLAKQEGGTKGPGSLRVGLLDRLKSISDSELRKLAKIEQL